MSWKSGSELFDKIIQVLGDYVDDEEIRESIYLQLIPVFEDNDCDTLYELLEQDKAFDAAYKSLYKPENESDDDVETYYTTLDD